MHSQHSAVTTVNILTNILLDLLKHAFLCVCVCVRVYVNILLDLLMHVCVCVCVCVCVIFYVHKHFLKGMVKKRKKKE
jgi:hypothetical protein